MATTVERKCKGCGGTFYPRLADVKRGWGKYCSKRCKAVKQEQRTRQYSQLQGGLIDADFDQSWDAHKNL